MTTDINLKIKYITNDNNITINNNSDVYTTNDMNNKSDELIKK